MLATRATELFAPFDRHLQTREFAWKHCNLLRCLVRYIFFVICASYAL
jgi:hypothetical protein